MPVAAHPARRCPSLAAPGGVGHCDTDRGACRRGGAYGRAGRDTISSNDQEVLDALDALIDNLQDSADKARAALRRAKTVRRQREKGVSMREVIDTDQDLLLTLLRATMDPLTEAGARFRRAQMTALFDEGMTMDEIGECFGITRQRVSAVIKQAEAERNAAGRRPGRPAGRARAAR